MPTRAKFANGDITVTQLLSTLVVCDHRSQPDDSSLSGMW